MSVPRHDAGSTFQHAKREKLTDRQRVKLFQLYGGKCADCGRIIRAEVWHADHDIALENGGRGDRDDDLTNWQVLCKNCHGIKTASDHGQAAKGRDQAVAHIVPKKQRTKKYPFKGWRKFDGTPVRNPRR